MGSCDIKQTSAGTSGLFDTGWFLRSAWSGGLWACLQSCDPPVGVATQPPDLILVLWCHQCLHQSSSGSAPWLSWPWRHLSVQRTFDLSPVSVPVAFCLSHVFIVLCSKQEVTSVWEFCLCAASTCTNSAVSADVHNKDVSTSSLTSSCLSSSWSHVCSASVCCPRRPDQQEVQRRKGGLWVL